MFTSFWNLDNLLGFGFSKLFNLVIAAQDMGVGELVSWYI